MFCLMLFLSINTYEAQSQILNRIEKKVNQRINRKTDQTIDKGLDKIEDAMKSKSKNNGATNKNNTPTNNKKGTSNSNNNQTTPASEPFQYNSKFDFIPGEKVIFFDDFEPDAIGDFPVKWNTNQSGEIVKINNIPNKWLRIPDNTVSFPELTTTLPLNFTIEFDLYYPASGKRPPITFGFSEIKDLSKTPIRNKSLFYFLIPASIKQAVGYSHSIYTGQETMTEWPVDKHVGKVIRASIAVNGTRIRLYLDDQKVIDVPKAFDKPVFRNNFHFRSSSLIPPPQDAFYISNLRIAETGTDARSSLLKNGKFSTSGIYFNTGSAAIKSNSHGIIKEIATVLSENPDLKIKIVGHTDNVGNPSSNKKLSEERAASVKEYLNKVFNIDMSRMSTEGLGDTNPATTNSTTEGKAQNRRVEFIKIN